MDFVEAPELRIRRGLRTLPLVFHFAKIWNPDEYGIQPDDVLCVCRAMLSEICYQLFDQNKFSKARTESFRSVKAWVSRIPFESYALKSLQLSIADSVLYHAEDNELNDVATSAYFEISRWCGVKNTSRNCFLSSFLQDFENVQTETTENGKGVISVFGYPLFPHVSPNVGEGFWDFLSWPQLAFEEQKNGYFGITGTKGLSKGSPWTGSCSDR